jgi:hypothetical protein
MGCDIHIHAEVKRGEAWEKVGAIFKNDYYDPERPSKTDSDGYTWNPKYTDEPYDGRNYRLFAILADVRNYDGWKPISSPRGLPEDVSPGIKEKSDGWDCDGHSHTFFTLKELLDFNWDKVVGKTTRMVSEATHKKYLETGGLPDSWCKSTNAPGWRELSWETTYKDCAGGCFLGMLDYLSKIGAPEDIRLVFWFDN